MSPLHEYRGLEVLLSCRPQAYKTAAMPILAEAFPDAGCDNEAIRQQLGDLLIPENGKREHSR
jgi:hypothetical protein